MLRVREHTATRCSSPNTKRSSLSHLHQVFVPVQLWPVCHHIFLPSLNGNLVKLLRFCNRFWHKSMRRRSRLSKNSSQFVQNLSLSLVNFKHNKNAHTSCDGQKTYLDMFLARQSFRQISPMPGKWLILCRGTCRHNNVVRAIILHSSTPTLS